MRIDFDSLVAYEDLIANPERILKKVEVKGKIVILKNNKSNGLFSSESISHHVEGIISNHPILKTRIVEFDEEQHFTPAKIKGDLIIMVTLKNLPMIITIISPLLN